MKIAVVGDLHGEEPDIDREEMEEADFILATDDFCAGRDEVRSLMFESIGQLPRPEGRGLSVNSSSNPYAG